MKSLPKIVFDSSAFAPADAAAAWAHFNSKTHTVTALEIEGREFSTLSTTWMAERVFFIDAHLHLQTKTIKTQSAVPTAERRAMLGWMCKSGGCHFLHNGQAAELRPGDFFMFDLSGEMSGLMLDMDVYGIIMPHAEIDYQAGMFPQGVLFKAASREAQAVKNLFETSITSLPKAKAGDAAEYAARAKRVIYPLVHNYKALKAQPKQLEQEILDYIDEHILDPDLSTEHLMQQFDYSRARLYEIVQLPASFDAYVLVRRLDYALRSLAFGPESSDRYGIIASRLGFSSQDEFDQAFESQFGFAPKTVLGVLATERPEPNGKLWNTWLDDDYGAH